MKIYVYSANWTKKERDAHAPKFSKRHFHGVFVCHESKLQNSAQLVGTLDRLIEFARVLNTSIVFNTDLKDKREEVIRYLESKNVDVIILEKK